ncbi:hypothetical protein [Parafilimonas terrae]|uniref:Uncharacterized protein n=1 Tax=Parafilimonas terrae TaxID=1465490 RepID=A0A1I5SBM3_9BACT|nr:hypothetical protein [Parafilimonas terrae]SFP68111.1 hypothetical protein SAMN05444277_101686 [Parafilimonas terrae]
MLSKNKTFIAFTVKFLFAAAALQAQPANDSARQKMDSLAVMRQFIFSIKQPPLPKQLPGNFYTKQLPFFCSKELLVQKAVGFPVKFRIGSVEYCDRLEGKTGKF